MSQRIENVEEERPNSFRRELIQDAIMANALYLALVDDLATALCFDDFHKMRLEL